MPTKAEQDERRRLRDIAVQAAGEIIYAVKLNRANLKQSVVANIVTSAIDAALHPRTAAQGEGGMEK